MTQTTTISLAHLDELRYTAQAYLDATVTKCDSPEIRATRSALVKALVIPNLACDVLKSQIAVQVTTRENDV
mgnify:CR=1 FL=1